MSDASEPDYADSQQDKSRTREHSSVKNSDDGGGRVASYLEKSGSLIINEDPWNIDSYSSSPWGSDPIDIPSEIPSKASCSRAGTSTTQETCSWQFVLKEPSKLQGSGEEIDQGEEEVGQAAARSGNNILPANSHPKKFAGSWDRGSTSSSPVEGKGAVGRRSSSAGEDSSEAERGSEAPQLPPRPKCFSSPLKKKAGSKSSLKIDEDSGTDSMTQNRMNELLVDGWPSGQSTGTSLQNWRNINFSGSSLPPEMYSGEMAYSDDYFRTTDDAFIDKELDRATSILESAGADGSPPQNAGGASSSSEYSVYQQDEKYRPYSLDTEELHDSATVSNNSSPEVSAPSGTSRDLRSAQESANPESPATRKQLNVEGDPLLREVKPTFSRYTIRRKKQFTPSPDAESYAIQHEGYDPGLHPSLPTYPPLPLGTVDAYKSDQDRPDSCDLKNLDDIAYTPLSQQFRGQSAYEYYKSQQRTDQTDAQRVEKVDPPKSSPSTPPQNKSPIPPPPKGMRGAHKSTDSVARSDLGPHTTPTAANLHPSAQSSGRLPLSSARKSFPEVGEQAASAPVSVAKPLGYYSVPQAPYDSSPNNDSFPAQGAQAPIGMAIPGDIQSAPAVVARSGGTAPSAQRRDSDVVKMSFEDTIRMYRMNAKKSQDPVVKFAFAKFCLAQSQKAKTKAAANELIEEGYKLLKKLALSGHADSMYTLGEAYLDDKRYDLGYAQLIQAAKRSHVGACFAVAKCNEKGYGTKKSNATALGFYTKAAQAGWKPALYRLGLAELNGELGLKPNPKKAVMWLRRAAAFTDKDNLESLLLLALIFEKGIPPHILPDVKYARGMLIEAAKLGSAPAQYVLGTAYESGRFGCHVDIRAAIFWYNSAARLRDTEAQFTLASWYLKGYPGVLEVNENYSYFWAYEAAVNGHSKAQYAVGNFSENGIGCQRDFYRAMRWYAIAVKNGNENARKRLLAEKNAHTKLAQSAQDTAGDPARTYKGGSNTKSGGFFRGKWK